MTTIIDISERARQHFKHLLAQQNVEGMGIRMRVHAPATPAARCELEFCEAQELTGSEWTIECGDFNLYVDSEHATYLDGAHIDYEPNQTGGQLNIRAPKLRGKMPDMDAGVMERVHYVLESDINPRLAAHGGRVTLLEVDAAGVVVLQFGGGCHGCGMVDSTLKQGVEKTLFEKVPEITAVRDATDHATGRAPYYQ